MHRKILFELEQDEDGYPPVGSETVWAIPKGGDHYVIDNIPFFVHEATLGDVVEATEQDGELRYRSIVKESGNSLIRIVYYPGTDPSQLCEHLKNLGCSSEWDENHRLIAVNVPPDVRLEDVQAFLKQGCEEQRWGYEEPILMQ